MLKLIKPRLKEVYKIKIGIKGKKTNGGYRLPQKIDHFRIVTNKKDENGDFIVAENIMNKLEKNPRKLPILLLYNNIKDNFFSSLAYYTRSRLICSGDGEKAKHYDEKTKKYVAHDCLGGQCTYFIEGKCKPSGILKCVLMVDENIGGAAIFRTHAWNSITYITSSIMTLLSLSDNNIAGVPLWLIVSPETRIVEGKQRIIFTVSLEFKGKIKDLKSGNFTKQSVPDKLPDYNESPADIADEFYPNELKELWF